MMRMLEGFIGRFLVRVVFAVVVIPFAAVYITLFCRVHFCLRDKCNFYETETSILSQGTRSGNLVYASGVSLRECMGLR